MKTDTRPRRQVITIEEIVNSLYIDFEGFGRSPRDPCPHPHMLGVYKPGLGVQAATYDAFLFRESWKPVANGSRGRAILSNLYEALDWILEEAESGGGRIVHFSMHEETVIETHCREFCDDFQAYSFNVKPPLDRMYNQILTDVVGKPHTLDEHMETWFPDYDMTKLPGGAADACRTIDKTAERLRRWKRWSDGEKSRAHELLDYNCNDCEATFKLATLLAFHQAKTLD